MELELIQLSLLAVQSPIKRSVRWLLFFHKLASIGDINEKQLRPDAMELRDANFVRDVLRLTLVIFIGYAPHIHQSERCQLAKNIFKPIDHAVSF